MSESNESDEHGALIVVPEVPLPGRFTMLISDPFCFEVTETKGGVRLDFRRRCASGRRCGGGSWGYDGTDAETVGCPRGRIERPDVQAIRGEGEGQPADADVVEVEAQEREEYGCGHAELRRGDAAMLVVVRR